VDLVWSVLISFFVLLLCTLSAAGKALRDNGLGDGEYVETVAGGIGANSEAPIDRCS
jgi:hypothetical protein